MGRRFYAVRSGRNAGIYETWRECSEQVHGYKGAVFKSFDTREEAAAYLQPDPDEQLETDMSLPFAFVDGSFKPDKQIYGYGGFIVHGGGVIIIQGTGNNERFLPHRNIAGEVFGVLRTVQEAIKAGIKEVNVFYDYSGLEEWSKGHWKTKNALTEYYAQIMDMYSDDIKVHFVKVKGHTGVKGNELADCLAKEAVGGELRSKKQRKALEAFRGMTSIESITDIDSIEM